MTWQIARISNTRHMWHVRWHWHVKFFFFFLLTFKILIGFIVSTPVLLQSMYPLKTLLWLKQHCQALPSSSSSSSSSSSKDLEFETSFCHHYSSKFNPNNISSLPHGSCLTITNNKNGFAANIWDTQELFYMRHRILFFEKVK